MTAAEQLRSRLPAVLGPVLGLRPADVAVDSLRMLQANVTRTTLAFDAVTPQGRRALILLTASPDVTQVSMKVQARAQVAAAAAGAPVPHILIADNSSAALGNPFLICDAVEGATDLSRIQRQLDNADRPTLLRRCAEVLAAIHRADTADPELSREDQLRYWRALLDSTGDTTATFEWAFRWLVTHQPPSSPTALVHGDYRPGNLLVNGHDVVAVIDWEHVHVGEAYEDLAWFCLRAWRLGAPTSLGASGLGSIESFLCAYEEAGQTPVDRARFDWWRLLATLRRGVRSRYEMYRLLRGQGHPVLWMALARRGVVQTEWELLDLLDPVAAHMKSGNGNPPRPSGPDPMLAGRHTSYGRPTAAELVADGCGVPGNRCREGEGR